MINLLWIKRSASQPFFIGDSWDTLLLFKAIAKEHVRSPQSRIDSCHSVAFVHQLTDEILDDLLIELIHELDLRR